MRRRFERSNYGAVFFSSVGTFYKQGVTISGAKFIMISEHKICAAKRISSRLGKAVKAAQRYFDWRAAEAAGNAELNVIDNASPLFCAFNFFLSVTGNPLRRSHKDDMNSSRDAMMNKVRQEQIHSQLSL
jgi:hypothetical protein